MSAVEKVYFFDDSLSLTPKYAQKPRPAVWFPGIAGLFLILSVAILLVIYLMLDAKIVNIQYRLSHLETDKVKYVENNSMLALEVEKLSALSRIEQIARKNLGMEAPEERIIIKPSEIAGVSMPTAAAYHQEAPVGLP